MSRYPLMMAVCLWLLPETATAQTPAEIRQTLSTARAWLYDDGPGTGEDVATALRSLAGAGEARADMMLGFMYRYGRGVEANLDRALGHYLAASAAGIARATMNATAVALELGRGAEAARLLDAIPDSTAWHLRARGHLDGILPGADPERGAAYLRAGLAAGDVQSAREALRRLSRGERLDVPGQAAVDTALSAAMAGDVYAGISVVDFVNRRPELVRVPGGPQALAAQLQVPPDLLLETEIRGVLARDRSSRGRRAVVALLEAAESSDYGKVLARLRWIDKQAFLAAIQSAMIRTEDFGGRVTGGMTPRFTLALRQYCAANKLPAACQRDDLDGVTSRALAELLAASHVPR